MQNPLLSNEIDTNDMLVTPPTIPLTNTKPRPYMDIRYELLFFIAVSFNDLETGSI